MLRPGRWPSRTERARFRARPRPSPGCSHPNIVQIYEVGEQRRAAVPRPGVRRRAARLADRRSTAAPHAAPGGRRAGRHPGPGGPPRPRPRGRPPRPEAGEHPARPAPTAHADEVESRLRAGQAARRRRRASTQTGDGRRHPELHGPGAGPRAGRRRRPAGRRVRPRGHPVRVADRPPAVPGATPLDTVLPGARTTSRSRPRRLAPGVPRDLETVCLKCLEKDPRPPVRRRPPPWPTTWTGSSAGEPVLARPVGRPARALAVGRRRHADGGGA